MNTSSTLVFFVNGRKIVEDNVDPESTLLEYLRNKLRLCGTKLACGEGGCGACTVMFSKYDRANNKVIHYPVNSCLAPICSVHGLAVTTIEGIGSTSAKLHPVQERIAKAHGSQCGFCTPGIVMSMYSLLRNNPTPSMKTVELSLQGNLCRCTGYRPILEGFKTFTEDWELMRNDCLENGPNCPLGKNCCKFKTEDDAVLFKPSEFVPYDPTQEPIFPPELKVSETFDKQYLSFQSEHVTWFRPTTLQQLLDLKDRYPEAKIVVGNTEIGVEVKFKNQTYPVFIQPSLIVEMSEYKFEQDHIVLGAAVTLQTLEDLLKIQIETQPEYRTRSFRSIVRMLQLFASKQIRNVACIGGNIVTGSPTSDLNPIFMAAGAKLTLQNKHGVRQILLNQDFFTGYRKTIIKNNEVLLSVEIPYSKENQYFYAYKQSRRRDDDMAILNSAINVSFKQNENVIEDIKLAFGSIAATTVMAPKTQTLLIGLKWNEETFEKACTTLLEELVLPANAPGGMVQYRKSLALSFFYKAYINIRQCLNNDTDSIKDEFTRTIPKSTQFFQTVPESQNRHDPVGRPIVHKSAFKQACGEAIYCDDMPPLYNELQMSLVLSQKAHANIKSIDASQALSVNNVVGFISAKDLTEKQNKLRIDEEVFVSKTVTSQGQIIGAILANTKKDAQRAAKLVRVDYEELHPIIVSIEDAIKHNSFYTDTQTSISKGDVEIAFKNSKHIIEGETRTGGQEHFYLEPQCAIVIPKLEDDEYEILSATQDPTVIASLTSKLLNVPQNRIVVKTKRLGGAFGGKETKPPLIILPAVVAASKFKRPVRVVLNRDEDMLLTAGRNPFLIKYKVGFDAQGKMLAFHSDMYLNAGHSVESSHFVSKRAMMHILNGYYVPAVKINVVCCKTNLPSNTAFRGFGAPQAMFAAETVIRDIAEFLNKDHIEIAKLNFISNGALTHYNQPQTHCTLSRCWSECMELADFCERRTAVEQFNKTNRWRKRGISIVPSLYGIGYGVPFLSQGGALVTIYADGSVLLSHGGVEMGQGLLTKMIQVASRVLEIPSDHIHTVETSIDKVPNTIATAASVGSDINGMAIMDACQKLNKRLAPIKKQFPNYTWKEIIEEAFMQRTSLSATGFYATPDITYDWTTNSGRYYDYYVYGAAVSEVEIDCLTGDHQVLRTDIVMDIGESLNPAIDIGQIEGAFMQGYGLFVMEEMMYSPTGSVYTKGPGSYKIPGFTDIPLEFNVSLLKGVSNPRAVYSSKAVGEPPLFSASSVFFAIREAIKAARIDSGFATKMLKLDAPATPAKIRMNCQDHITAKICQVDETSADVWNVVP